MSENNIENSGKLDSQPQGSKKPDDRQLDNNCPSCGTEMKPFYTFKNVPTNSCILMETAEEARQYPRGDIVLGHCESCGFIRNLAFVPELTEYSGKYEETQGYSPTFQRFHDDLAKDLVDRYKLHNKSVLEIGCGTAATCRRAPCTRTASPRLPCARPTQ